MDAPRAEQGRPKTARRSDAAVVEDERLKNGLHAVMAKLREFPEIVSAAERQLGSFEFERMADFYTLLWNLNDQVLGRGAKQQQQQQRTGSSSASRGSYSASSANAMFKIPAAALNDFRPDGALFTILYIALEFFRDNKLDTIDATTPDGVTLALEMFALVEAALRSQNHIASRRVFFSKSVPAKIQPGLRAALKDRAAIVSVASKATHIIYQDPEGTRTFETDGEDYCRALAERKDHCFVHWWYYPDSYDSWIPRTEVEGDPEVEEISERVWHVQVRWIQDSQLFNEWVNELDYEVPQEMRIVLPVAAETASAQGPAAAAVPATSNISGSPASTARKKSGEVLETSGAAKAQRSGKGLPTTAAPTSEVGPEASSSPPIPKRALERSRDVEPGVASASSHTASTLANADTEHSAKHVDGDRVAPRSTGSTHDPQEPAGSSQQHQAASITPASKPASKKSRKRARSDSAEDTAAQTPLETPRETPRVKKRPMGELLDQKNEGERQAGKMDVSAPEAESEKKRTVGSSHAGVGDVESKQNVLPFPGALDFKTSRKEEQTHQASWETALTGAGPAEDKDVNEDKREISKEKGQQAPQPDEDLVLQQSALAAGVTVREVGQSEAPVESDFRRVRNISQNMPDAIKAAVVAQSLDVGVDSPDGVVQQKPLADPTGDVKEEGMEETASTPEAVEDQNQAAHAAPVPGVRTVTEILDSLPNEPVLIPSYSQWFSPDSIHPIEKRSLPEFFVSEGSGTAVSSSKTPKVYKEYRDFMVDAWLCDPKRYLTATAVRKHLAGDVCSIIRVHSFLEHWGLINYMVDAEHRSLTGAPHSVLASGAALAVGVSGEQHLSSLAPGNVSTTAVPRVLLFDDPMSVFEDTKTAGTLAGTSGGLPSNALASRRDVFAAASAIEYRCDYCKEDCARVRFHCASHLDLDLCPKCYSEGRFPSNVQSRDFIQMTATTIDSNSTLWTESETLLLLEALELYQDNWDRVAQHVGSKSKEACVLHFLRLPIEDQYLADVAPGRSGSPVTDPGASLANGLPAKSSIIAEHPLPFGDTSNPIMAQIALMASSISPEVAAAAAKAALKALIDGQQARMSQSTRNEEKGAETAGHSHENAGTENSATNDQTQHPPTQSSGPATSRNPAALDGHALEVATAAGLAAAAIKASQLAAAEQREIDRLFCVVIGMKLKSIEMKINQLEKFERHVRTEQDRLLKKRTHTFADRIAGLPESALVDQQGRRDGESRTDASVALNAGAASSPKEFRPLQAVPRGELPGHGSVPSLAHRTAEAAVQSGNVTVTPVRAAVALPDASGTPAVAGAAGAAVVGDALTGGAPLQTAPTTAQVYIPSTEADTAAQFRATASNSEQASQ
ncbi:SWI/SNF and RSC complexes subunit ssr2 [Porphyridium purpureum]|uniref:SWI/SNF and RSC complexes subunit ssr2 n=1 Tax=Porphyridium purpureum TaxID=35688 RepID=A0A5J4YXT5_PORPP|nr:SWI/SNF and RSC complexes subunit ssr2 [Porphyridium purpureum]|eukprot:POR6433..scf209_3